MAKQPAKPNYAMQGATSEEATLMGRQADQAHAQMQANAQQMQPVNPQASGAGPAKGLPPEAVNLAPNDMGPQGLPSGDPDDMNFLYADPKNPADLQTIMQQAQEQNYSRDIPVPTRLLRYLPILRQMAYDPDAPKSVQAFYRHVVDSIERRRQQ
jgi:hypothetical protein